MSYGNVKIFLKIYKENIVVINVLKTNCNAFVKTFSKILSQGFDEQMSDYKNFHSLYTLHTVSIESIKCVEILFKLNV